MFKEFDQWEINFNYEDLFDTDAALREVSTVTSMDFSPVPPVDYSELEIFDSVTPGFGIALDIFQTELGEMIITESNLRYVPHNALSTLMEVSSLDLLDTAKVFTETMHSNDYHVSQVFSHEGVDIDSYDTVSIKMPDVFPVSGDSTDWPAIFGEIERYVEKTITEDISDVVISDTQYKPTRSGMTLVKGNRRKNLFSSFEYSIAESQNLSTFNESRSSAQGQSFNIPMQLYLENGELFFRINLTGIDLRNLPRIEHLPHDMNMKSVLSLIPRQSKAK
ncbi:MAG: hypothetical protein ACM3PE_12820 [Deltaproteobacteria bacterium]